MNAILAIVAISFGSAPTIVVSDLSGKKLRLPVAGKPTVLFFVGTECPIANRMAPELKRIVSSHKEVAFYFVYPEKGLTKRAVLKHARDFNLGAPSLLDPSFSIAKFARAKVTPEAALFDKTGKLAYHGRINDSYSEHNVPREIPIKHDLRVALSAVLKRKPVANPFVPAVGCPIPF